MNRKLFNSLVKSIKEMGKIQLKRRIKNLEAKVKSQAHHIELLNQCDDSSTEVIAKMDGEIEQLGGRNQHLEAVIAAQKETIRNQGAGCEARHNTLCEIKEIIDHYFMKG